MDRARQWTVAVPIATLLILGARAGRAPAAEGRPNVVLILADDLGWGDVGFNGRTEWATPNLDRLGASGTIFKRFYTAAVVCAPSRAALLTGKYTIHDGVTGNNEDLPASEVTLAEALKAPGLRHGPVRQVAPRQAEGRARRPTSTRWTRGSTSSSASPTPSTPGRSSPRTLWDGREQVPVSGYADDLFTDRAVDFLRRHKAGPFFLYLPYITSHFNIEAPADEVALHRGKFAEADPSRAAQRDLRGDGHAARQERRPGPGRARRAGAGRRDAGHLLQRPRRDVRGGQPGDQRLPRQQPPVPGPEADALGGGHPRPRRRPVAGPHPGRGRLERGRPHDRPLPDRSWPPPAPRPTRPGRWTASNLLARLDRPGSRRPSGPCSGSGGSRDRTSSPRCEGGTSWSSPTAASPSCSTSRPTPPSAATSSPQHPDLAKRLQAELKAWLATAIDDPSRSKAEVGAPGRPVLSPER